MMIDYLPIGSVVQLDETEVLFMIVGLAVENENNIRKDYLAVKYPMGVLNSDSYYFFDHSIIKKIVHQGYSSVDHDVYKRLLNNLLEGDKNG